MAEGAVKPGPSVTYRQTKVSKAIVKRGPTYTCKGTEPAAIYNRAR